MISLAGEMITQLPRLEKPPKMIILLWLFSLSELGLPSEEASWYLGNLARARKKSKAYNFFLFGP